MKLIVSAMLMGRAAVISAEDEWYNRGEPSYGSDSHVSVSRTAYIVFNSAQILPCYVLHLDWTRSNAEEIDTFLYHTLSTSTVTAGEQRRCRKAEMTMAPG
jgi:hypothetical protein